MDFSLFIGRLHPLVVHLPIGFLLVAILLEWFKNKDRSAGWDKAISFILMGGTLAAILAALFGWLLANTGGYNDSTLFWHRWLGIATAVVAALAWWSKRMSRQKAYTFALWSMGLLLIITGHLGGSLTHGADYLIQPFSGDPEKGKIAMALPARPDSVVIFTHLVQPVLANKCYSCHNEEKQKGSLNLATWQGIEKGGENGEIIESSAWDSEIFNRVTLPQNSKKFMPLKGNPLTYSEISILKWWIDIGAKPDDRLLAHKVPVEIKHILIREYNLDPRPRPFVETVQISPLPEATLSSIAAQGWKINLLGENNFLLEVSPARADSLPGSTLDSLIKIKDHVTWLNLAKSGVSDIDLKIISQFPNLSRLRLENNSITDAGLQYLVDLKNLESLNLYGNPISDDGLIFIEKMPALKRVYLWKTKVTPQGLEVLRTGRPGLVVDTGLQFAEVEN